MLSQNDLEVLRVIHQGTRDFICYLSWCSDPRDAASVRHHASCFFLKVGGRTFGVTAAHVIDAFAIDQADCGSLTFNVGNLELPILERLIDCGTGPTTGLTMVDIATFEITEQEINLIGKRYKEYSDRSWPPPPLVEGQGLVLTGYPSDGRVVLNKTAVEYNQVSNYLNTRLVTPEQMHIRVETEHVCTIHGKPVASLTDAIGGYSGAPILAVSISLGGLYEVAGVLSEGLLRPGEKGPFIDFRAVTSTRIQGNGKLWRGTV